MRSVDILVAFVSVSIVAGCSVTPDQEYQIGASEAAQIDSEMPLIRDSAIVGYVAKLGKSMASRTSRADLDWHFSLVNSPEVNAFALPGGFVYVNRGAIEQADRMDELAGIIGHEIEQGRSVFRRIRNEQDRQHRSPDDGDPRVHATERRHPAAACSHRSG